MQLPKIFIDSLSGTNGFSKNAFVQIHFSGEQVTSIRINPNKLSSVSEVLFEEKMPENVQWSGYGYYLKSRPSFTFDPLFHAGCYYVQEASSMFLEQVLKQAVDLTQPLKVLDLCAAPGGKSTHIQSLISNESLLVSNDVIRSRANVLKDNIIKWGCQNVVVTNNDPSHFAKLENFFDVIVVDAPCSGSGLFRRDPEAIYEWSSNNVQLCSQRQQRIIADAWPALKQNGILIYSTCSYSKEEDDDICKWISNDFSVTALPLHIAAGWGIVESSGGYRFWPDKIKGEGFFLACFQKNDGGEFAGYKVKNKPGVILKQDLPLIEEWVATTGCQLIKHRQTVYAWPQMLATDFAYLVEKLKVIYSGTVCGEIMRNKMVPSHALAMSKMLAENIRTIELNKEQAIRFLQRKEIQPVLHDTGWKIVTYQGHPLGWLNVLANRTNNYYPKELKIVKENE